MENNTFCVLPFTENEVPLQERRNYKSSPEIQVGNYRGFICCFHMSVLQLLTHLLASASLITPFRTVL